ncbi:MAG: VWA domain-containing protein [Planctomycetota bacterium]
MSANGVEVEIAGEKITVTSQDIKRRYWSGTIAPSEKIRQEIAEKGRAVIRVKIGEAGGEYPHLDTDPGTIAEFDTAAKVWTKYEQGGEPDAGFDTWHKFGVAKGTSFVIVLDKSGSMEGVGDNGKSTKLEEAKIALAKAVDKMGPDDEFAFFVFDGCGEGSVRLLVPFTTDKQAVIDAAKGVEPGGSTALALAISIAREYMQKNARRKHTSMLVFSDGGESCGGDPMRESEKVTKPPPEPPRSEPEEDPEHPCKNEYRVAYRVLPPAATRHVPDIYVEEMRYRKKRIGKKCTLMVTILKRHIDYASSVDLETGERRTAWGLGGISDRQPPEIVDDIHTEKEKAQKLENKAKEYTMTRAEALAEVAKLVKAAVEGGAEPPSP